MSRFYRMLSVFILGVLLGAPSVSRAAEEGVQNVRFQVQGQKVHVSYDLIGKGAYTVTLQSVREEGRPWVPGLRSLSGDVGKGIQPGKKKEIVWDVLKDVERLEGDNFVFEVRAARPGGTSKWVWIGGAGVAAGAAGAVVLGGGGGEEKGTIVIDVPDPEE